MRWIAVVRTALLAALPSISVAIEATCAGCIDNCCEWAFSASTALYSRLPSIDAYSWKSWERHGFPPAPCREELHDAAQYQRCVTKAFDRCYKERCKGCSISWIPFRGAFRPTYEERQRRAISGTEPVELHPGQETVLGRIEGRWQEDQAIGGGTRPVSRVAPRRPVSEGQELRLAMQLR